MLLTILGWIWIVFGLVVLLNPQATKEYLSRQNPEVLKKVFAFLAFLIGILFINATWGLKGFWAKFILVCGFIALFKAIYFLKAKSAERLLQWSFSRPIGAFRIWSVAVIIFGAIILSL